jgi:hypothetical protein
MPRREPSQTRPSGRPPPLRSAGTPRSSRGADPLPHNWGKGPALGSEPGRPEDGLRPAFLFLPPGWPHAAVPAAAGVVRDVAAQLRSGRAAGLAAMPVAEIIAAVDRAVAVWRAPALRERRAEIEELAAVTGYHPAMVALALDDLARTFNATGLKRLLARELPSPAVLDRFVARPDGGGWTRAFGPELTAIVLSGNVFHVAAESVILALLAKSACLVKVSARDPLFPVLFVRSLAAADARLAEALAVAWWPGGDAAVEEAAFGAADTVAVYGDADAVAGVRARTPATTRMVIHGPKISFAVVAHSHAGGPNADETAEHAAHDIAMFDQQGCVSPHTIYVEGGPEDAQTFARLLAPALARVEQEVPRGSISPTAAARIQQTRGAAEFRPGAEMLASPEGTAWTVIFDPDPSFAPSCLNRLVWVKPLARLADLPKLLAPIRPYLQTCGVAGDDAARLATAQVVGPLGVARVCALGRMQHPPAAWRHDGRPRLLDLLRWTDLETDGKETTRSQGSSKP